MAPPARGSQPASLGNVDDLGGDDWDGETVVKAPAALTPKRRERESRPFNPDETVNIAGDIHGESGLDGPVLPEPELALDPRHAVDLIIDTVMAHPPGTVTLVPTGPLTNVALAVRKEPRIVERKVG